ARRLHRLQQVVGGALLEGGEGVLVVGGHEDDVAAAVRLLRDLESREPRHVDVEEQDVGGMLLERLEGGDAVSGLGDHREIGPERSEELGELFAQQRLVLGDDGACGWQGAAMIASQSALVPGQLERASSLGTRVELTTMWSYSWFAAMACSAPWTMATCSAARAEPFTARARARIKRRVFEVMAFLPASMDGSVGGVPAPDN